LRSLCQDLEQLSPDELFDRGVHDELTRIIDTTATICQAIHSDYFDPDIALGSRPPQSAQQ
jgi:hypothetical protein